MAKHNLGLEGSLGVAHTSTVAHDVVPYNKGIDISPSLSTNLNILDSSPTHTLPSPTSIRSRSSIIPVPGVFDCCVRGL